jgi:hypothetical protein
MLDGVMPVSETIIGSGLMLEDTNAFGNEMGTDGIERLMSSVFTRRECTDYLTGS